MTVRVIVTIVNESTLIQLQNGRAIIILTID